MSVPARAGLFIYAEKMDELIRFYESVLSAELKHRTEDVAVFQSPDIQMIIHQMPPDRDSKI